MKVKDPHCPRCNTPMEHGSMNIPYGASVKEGVVHYQPTALSIDVLNYHDFWYCKTCDRKYQVEIEGEEGEKVQ